MPALQGTKDRLKTINLLIKNTGQYFANKKVYAEYLQTRNKKAFRKTHTTEIMLYEAARKELKALSGGKPIPTMKQLKAEKASNTKPSPSPEASGMSYRLSSKT